MAILKVKDQDGKSYEIPCLVGKTGPKGDTGLVWRGEWDDTKAYKMGDAVLYNGSAYICIENNLPDGHSPDMGGWDLLAEKGSKGDTGIVWRGEWDENGSYDVGDAVCYKGSAYLCICERTPLEPSESSTDWNLLAEKGTKGETGDSGVYVLANGETLANAPGDAGVVIDTNGDADMTDIINAVLAALPAWEGGSY